MFNKISFVWLCLTALGLLAPVSAGAADSVMHIGWGKIAKRTAAVSEAIMSSRHNLLSYPRKLHNYLQQMHVEFIIMI
jgi:hypothetical protein